MASLFNRTLKRPQFQGVHAISDSIAVPTTIREKTQVQKTLFVVVVAAAALLAGCVSPTLYRAAGVDGKPFGYTSNKLSEPIYRVRFQGNGRTSWRWIDAFLLYRAAEVAQEAGAPAFKIIEGKVDATVLTGEDVFGAVDSQAELMVVAVHRRPVPEGDVVVGSALGDANMHRTAGAMPVFRMPPPALPKYQPPVYIYTPGYAAPALPDRSILIELRADLAEKGDNIFETTDVLRKLGTRIRRGPATATPPVAKPSSL